MKTMQDLVEQLTGPELVNALVEQLNEHMEDFREDHRRYLSAVNQLKAELGSSVDEVVAAIYKRTAEGLFFAGSLGLKMNIDHFVNPMTPNCTWPQVDYNDYLREDLMRSLPEYAPAETVLSNFSKSLTERQRELYTAITEYESHLATAGPKLAHYYGYLLGNTLLYKLIPGYRADMVLTVRYNTMMNAYFGKQFLPTSL